MKSINMDVRFRIIAYVLVFAMILGAAYAPPGYAIGEFDERVPELFAKPITGENPQVVQSTPKIRRLMNDVYYEDIDRVMGKREIVRMTAVGVLNPQGERNYRPAEAATGFEVLDGVFGVMGARAALVSGVQGEAGTSTPPERLRQMFQRALYKDAETRGILPKNELLGLGEPVSRERAALFLARAIGANAEAEQSQVYTFADWQQTEPYARPLVETLVKNGVVTMASGGGFAPKSNITKAELAIWLDRAFDRNLGLTGSQIGYGVVVGINETVERSGADEILKRTVVLRDQNGAPVHLVSTERNGQQVEDYITYRAGNISTSRQLAIGDEIEYITVGGRIRYAGLIDNGQVLLQLIEDDPYTYIHYGNVIGIRTVAINEGDYTTTKEIYRVRDITGDAFDIVVFENGKTGIREDIVTIKGGIVGGVRQMKVGDSVQYTTNELRQVGYIKIGELEKQHISGTINKVEQGTGTEPNYVTIFDYEGQLKKFRIESPAVLSINGRIAKLSDFVYGLAVSANVVNDGVITLRGESFGSAAGYIPPFGKMRTGTVINQSSGGFTIKKMNGETELVLVGARTFFSKTGSPSSINGLKTGEKVKIYFDYITGNIASRVEIEAPEQHYDRIYRGRMLNITTQNRRIELVGSDGSDSPEYVSNDKWESSGGYSRDILIDPQCEIYVDNEPVTVENLERLYRGYDVYAVTKEIFGRETAVKLSVRRGPEMLYSSAVRGIDHTLGEFEILTKDNFEITKATILLKDGLLVPSGELRRRDTVFVASEISGKKKNAMFVRAVSGVEASPDSVKTLLSSLRIGALEGVAPSSVTLANHTKLSDYAFGSVKSAVSEQFYLSSGSDIKDISDEENIKQLSPSMLFHNKYARTETADTKMGLRYKRYYAFMVVNPANNVVVAMNLRKAGLMANDLIDNKLKKETDIAAALEKTLKDAVVTRGVVTSNDTDWDRIELTEAYDFVRYTSRWSAVGTNIYVKYSDAIVIKDNRTIGIDEVQMGDYIYVVRIGTDSLFIFVE